MKTFALRLKPGQDLKEELVKFTRESHIQAGCILTCVGSLKRASLRMADENVTKELEKKFEITSLVGTLSLDGVHLHITLTDETGSAIGGHLKENCLIYSTAEIVIGELENVTFSRQPDAETGFKELNIISRQ